MQLNPRSVVMNNRSAPTDISVLNVYCCKSHYGHRAPGCNSCRDGEVYTPPP